MKLFDTSPIIGEAGEGSYRRIHWDSRNKIAAPLAGEEVLVIDAEKFPPEGDDCDAVLLAQGLPGGLAALHRLPPAWPALHRRGPRPRHRRRAHRHLRIERRLSGERHGRRGDLHPRQRPGSGGQIAKRGKLVIYGDVGQTFMYGAKGGEVFVLGNGGGPAAHQRRRSPAGGHQRHLPRLSWPSRSWPAIRSTAAASSSSTASSSTRTPSWCRWPRRIPGSNLFSLASGGAIYVRDPGKKVVEQQLNGGVFAPFTDADWRLIRTYLDENERLFGIKVQDLLTVNGKLCEPEDVYRKVSAQALAVLAAATEKKK